MQLSSLFQATVSPGKACLLAAVPEEWIASIPAINPLTGTLDGDILLTGDHKWLSVVLVHPSRLFTEESGRDDAGLSWQSSISGRTCGQDADLHQLLERWAQHRWVLVYKEVGTEATYLVGKPGSGALMDLKYSNDKSTISSISFSRQSNRRAIIYKGSYTLDNNVTISNSTQVQRKFITTAGTEGTTLSIPELQGATILSASRSGATDLDILTDPLATLDTSRKCYFNKDNGQVKVGIDWPWGAEETLLILFYPS